MGKINVKINGTFHHCKLIEKNSHKQKIKEMGIKDMGIFNGTFSHNGNGKKYVN